MKVKVIGAGPSGSVAAISALKNSHEVEIFEEHEKAGYPQHCSGLISKEGLDSLSDLIDYKPSIINRISCAAFDFAGEKFEIRRKSETAYVINRAEFDIALAQKAEKEGAKIFYGKRFIHETQNHLVDGSTKSSSTHASVEGPEPKTIIGADGALSATAHHYDFPKIKKFAFTLKAKAKISCEEQEKVHLFYDNRYFPGFFAWLIPHNECEAEIGAGTTNPAYMKSAFDSILKKLGNPAHEKPHGKIIPLEQRKKIAGVFGNTNVLLVGDAAGHVKSSSGGGVVFGTAGARLAGEFAHSPVDYESKWKKENDADLRAHAFLQNFFAMQPDFSLRLTASSSKMMGLDYLFSLHGNMDRPVKSLRSIFSKAFNISPATIIGGDQLGSSIDN